MDKKRNGGFTLLELLAVMAFIALLTGSVLLLLNGSVQRFRVQSQLLDSFQMARLGIDQMTRDIHGAGYPPANTGWSFPAGQPLATPFSWDPGYVAGTPCTVGATCTMPIASDLIIEVSNPGAGVGVQWIRYTLNGTTLMRGVVTKTAVTDAVAATAAAGVMFPFVSNVINTAQGVPVFTFVCQDTSTPPVPKLCTDGTLTAPNNTAAYIRQVEITLIVQSAQPDPKTGTFPTASLNSDARVLNPIQ